MTDPERSPLDELFDLFVYAPLGFALDATEVIPDLAKRGRNGVQTARTVGTFAVGAIQKKVAAEAPGLEAVLAGFLRGFGAGPAAQPATPTAHAPDPSSTATVADVIDADIIAPDVVEAAIEDTAGVDVAVGEDDLPISSYDTLAASQIVPRLAGLDDAELAAVAAHEQANRGRRTVLNRVAQLQARRSEAAE